MYEYYIRKSSKTRHRIQRGLKENIPETLFHKNDIGPIPT
jgi:hypothetical protein